MELTHIIHVTGSAIELDRFYDQELAEADKPGTRLLPQAKYVRRSTAEVVVAIETSGERRVRDVVELSNLYPALRFRLELHDAEIIERAIGLMDEAMFEAGERIDGWNVKPTD